MLKCGKKASDYTEGFYGNCRSFMIIKKSFMVAYGEASARNYIYTSTVHTFIWTLADSKAGAWPCSGAMLRDYSKLLACSCLNLALR